MLARGKNKQDLMSARRGKRDGSDTGRTVSIIEESLRSRGKGNGQAHQGGSALGKQLEKASCKRIQSCGMDDDKNWEGKGEEPAIKMRAVKGCTISRTCNKR